MKTCEFCEESKLKVGEKTKYGAVIIYKIGNQDNGWFATLSPKTAGNPEEDFSIQIMPYKHLKYFSDINSNLELAKNYGIIFAKISYAVGSIIKDENKIPIGVYGKCKHEDEHIHLKIFPYRGKVGQPFTLDSSFERKEIYNDGHSIYIKMDPIKKSALKKERFEQLSKKLIEILR